MSRRQVVGKRGAVRTAAMAMMLLLGGLGVLPGATPADAATLTVNSTDDRSDSNPGDGACRTSRGECTLRAAVEEANRLPGPDTIRFNISGNRVHTIDIDEPLVLADRSGGTTIDGYSQSGASVNTHALESNADIRIEVTTNDDLDHMFLITSPANTIRGLSIYGDSRRRIELLGEEADGNRFLGNFVGFSTDLSETSNGGDGLEMNLGPDQNVIGTADRADRNVFSGNGSWGVRINHGETSRNIVENNIFGLGPRMEELATTQRGGIDLQWWTWANYVTGNLFAGLRSQGVDLSHSVTNTVVVNNRFGTYADGNSASDETELRWGLTFKDNPTRSYVADNVFANATESALYSRHNYNAPSIVANNRIGVGSGGAALPNERALLLRGHDDLYIGNIIANNDEGIFVSDDTFDPNAANTNFPSEETLRNRLRQNQYYNNDNFDLEFDDDFVPHDGIDAPEITDIGSGVVYGEACSRCEVEIYVSGTVRGNGELQLDRNVSGTGAGYIGRVEADRSGNWGLAHAGLLAQKTVTALAIDGDGNTSEFSDGVRVSSGRATVGPNADSSLAPVAVPAAPPRPPAYQVETFSCSYANGQLSWDNERAPEYYLRAVAADGSEQYLGARTGTGSAVPEADGYRVTHWARGFAVNAICDGPGDVAGFTCSVSGGTLSWTDQGVDQYFIRLVDNRGNDTFHSSASGTRVNVPSANSYQVIHWVGGRNIATCSR